MQKKVQELLADKRDAFLEYETHTNEILVSDPDAIEEHMRHRERLIKHIDILDKQLKELASQDQELYKALRCKGDRQALSDSLGAVYDSAQQVYAVVDRIFQAEPSALAHVQAQREILLQKIAEHNQSNDAIATKFYNDLHFEEQAEALGQLNQKA